MNKVIFLFLRRMRAPLVVLISAYAISILGLVLIPGIDGAGQPWHMDFFHAFYFVSYMATTIGFGELPFEFSDAQRLWTLVTIYLTVIAWLYAIGKILTLLQDSAFQQAVVEQAFARGIKHISEPFYIVCGYGDTGGLLVRALAQRGMRAVVLDISQDRINELELEDMGSYVPGLCADAGLSEPLKEAGLLNSHCTGVVALTDQDHVNLKIAITTKLLRPELTVICRAENQDTAANMASFGTDHIINPFETFGHRLALAVHAPGAHLIYEWLTGVPDAPLSTPLYPPHGTWILCGYGRFGKAVHQSLAREEVTATLVEIDPAGVGIDPQDCVVGRGTEVNTLELAGIRQAAGIVAGTDDDTNNLSIIMTAHELNPNLFMVARQNKRDNDDIFAAARVDLVMQRSDIIARTILALLTTPLLTDFLRRMQKYGNVWANELVSRLIAVTGEVVPEVWTVEINAQQAPAVCSNLDQGRPVTLSHLVHDPRDRDRYIPALALLLERRGQEHITPAEDMNLRAGDRLLFCGKPGASARMSWTLQNHNALRYIQTGLELPDSVVWRWISRLRQGKGRTI